MLSVRKLARLHLGPVDLDIPSGTCIALGGKSGSGKSMLLRAIADLDPSDGTVVLNGHERDAVAASDWRRQVGYLPAEPGWWAGRVSAHFSDWSACRGLAERLGIDPAAGDWSVSRLSTGERQRLGLMRLLENKPLCLLLDEPTSALDDVATEAVEALVSEHCAAGGCCLFVTHDKAQFSRVGSRGYRLQDGRLVEERAA